MKEAGITDVRTSINRSQNTVAQYSAMRPLLDLCEGSKQREGARVTMRGCDQTGIDWEKAKARGEETESEAASGMDTEGGEARDIVIVTLSQRTTAERKGWGVVLPLTGGGHEGSGDHRRTDVHKQKT